MPVFLAFARTHKTRMQNRTRTVVDEEDGGADAEPEEPPRPALGGEEGEGGVGEGGEGEGRRGPRRRLPGERQEEGQEEGEAIDRRRRFRSIYARNLGGERKGLISFCLLLSFLLCLGLGLGLGSCNLRCILCDVLRCCGKKHGSGI